MNALPDKPHSYEIEPLFECERDLPLEPDETRHRVVQRARRALPRSLRLTPAARAALPRGVRFGEVAAVAVLLSGLSLAAFYAGYRAKGRYAQGPVATPASVSTRIATSAVELPAATSALAPVPSPAQSSKGGVPAKSVPEIAAYISEVRVLQPARQAVADAKYASALAAIAEHQRRFAAGKLAEEREALRIKSLLGLGRVPEAQHAAAVFCEQFPDSVLLERVNELLRAPR